MQEYHIIKCPHCNDNIIIYHTDINCKIFRHAVYKHNLQPINPHSSKQICDDLVLNNQVFGCAKPFTFDGINAKICDYI